jgi:membrane protein YqaA with SNARE-associated domain
MHIDHQLFHRWELALLAFLKPLGLWGIGVLAAIDSSSVAIPMDLIIGGYVYSDPKHFLWYPILGGVGSALGALVPFFVGRAGGELVLLSRMNREKFENMQQRFERRRWTAVGIPAAMPPPFPFKVFAFGAGVFDTPILSFLVAVAVGRTLHYTVTALLVYYFGPHILNILVRGAQQHLPLVIALGTILCLAFVGYVFHRLRSRRRRATLPAA